jgi:23S rRNA pseudouridine1911/1915/1917 synthase
VVVDKPAGLVVHPTGAARGGTLVELLADLVAGGESSRPGVVHRLDRDTSGLLVLARNERARESLAEQIRTREALREYLALVEGALDSRTGTIDAPLGRHRGRRTRRAVGGAAPREARTHFEALERLPADTLVRAILETGRTHQIRVHFAAIGHPVAGDREYGSGGRHGLGRQFLHAARLGFEHPGTGEEMRFESELPPDLAAALERARSGESS